jgi:hypothetical protein
MQFFHTTKMRLLRIYRQEIKAISADGVKVKGQLVTIEVGKRIDALKRQASIYSCNFEIQ